MDGQAGQEGRPRPDHRLPVLPAPVRGRSTGRRGPRGAVGGPADPGRVLRRSARPGPVGAGDPARPEPWGLPDWISPNAATIYPVTAFTFDGAESLLRLLLRQPSETIPELGPAPSFPTRDHTLSGQTRPSTSTEALVAAAVQTMRHEIALHLSATEDGRIHARTELAGTVLGEQRSTLPVALPHCWDALRSGDGAQRLHTLGQTLWRTLFDTPTGTHLAELVATRVAGAAIELHVYLPEELSWLPIELLRTPDGALLATERGVSILRHLTEIPPRPTTPPSAGPLKILAAVAAPDETRTRNTPLDVEAEMQAILDAVTPLEPPPRGNSTSPHSASPHQPRHRRRRRRPGHRCGSSRSRHSPEIRDALGAEQFHVLHLSAHGSPTQIELEDEDGNPDPVSLDRARLGVTRREAPGAAAGAVILLRRSGRTRRTGRRRHPLRRGPGDRHAGPRHRPLRHPAHPCLYRELAANPARPSPPPSPSPAPRRRTDPQRHPPRQPPAPPPEWAIPTLLAANTDTPLRDTGLPAEPLARPAAPPAPDRGVRELPLGELIGRRPLLREAWSVIRRNQHDRDTVGEWAGVALIGVGGIGKTALAGRLLARARGNGWAVAEHVGTWNPDALFGSVADAIAATQPQAAAALRSPDSDQSAQTPAGSRRPAAATGCGAVRRLRTEPHPRHQHLHRPRLRRDLHRTRQRVQGRAHPRHLPLPRPRHRVATAHDSRPTPQPRRTAPPVPATTRAARAVPR